VLQYGSKEPAGRNTDEPKRKLHQLVLTPQVRWASSQMQSCFLAPGTDGRRRFARPSLYGRPMVTRAMEPRPMADGTPRGGACPDGPRSARTVDLAPTAGGARATELVRPADGGTVELAPMAGGARVAQVAWTVDGVVRGASCPARPRSMVPVAELV
jgi:hypothetical protein